MPSAKPPIHESQVEIQSWYQGTDREVHGRALCDQGGTAKIGFGLMELSPGCNTLPAHYHTREEEHIYVLEGVGTLHLGDATHRLEAGSYVNFPAGQAVPHYLSNPSEIPLTYIMVGERIAADEVVYAGDSRE